MTHLALGAIPRSIWVTLEDDLVDAVKPGDDVDVIGIVKKRWKPFSKNSEDRSDISLAIKALNVNVQNNVVASVIVTADAEKEFTIFWSKHENRDVLGRNQLLSFFCPLPKSGTETSGTLVRAAITLSMSSAPRLLGMVGGTRQAGLREEKSSSTSSPPSWEPPPASSSDRASVSMLGLLPP